MKKIKKRHFLLTFSDSDSELDKDAVAVIEIDSTERNLLKDIINRHLIDSKIVQAVNGWRACRYLRHTIENTERSFDLYSVHITMEDEDGECDSLFFLEEIEVI